MRSLRQSALASSSDFEHVQACKAAVSCVLPEAEVVLFGSRARGDATVESDFDFLIITPFLAEPDLQNRLSDAIYEVELDRAIMVTCIVCSREEWNGVLWRAAPLRANVEREGIAL